MIRNNKNLLGYLNHLSIYIKTYSGYLEDGTKVRVSKLTNSIIEKPKVANYLERHLEKKDGLKDTPANSVVDITYKGEDFALIKAEFDAWIAKKEEQEKWLVFDI